MNYEILLHDMIKGGDSIVWDDCSGYVKKWGVARLTWAMSQKWCWNFQGCDIPEVHPGDGVCVYIKYEDK